MSPNMDEIMAFQTDNIEYHRISKDRVGHGLKTRTLGPWPIALHKNNFSSAKKRSKVA
jgi:hypothetical protein